MTGTERKYLTAVGIIGVGLGAVGVFGNFCPGIPEIRQNGHDPAFVGHLRAGYLSSWALSLGIGGLVSVVDNSLLPLVAAGAASGVMNYTYERHLPAQHRLSSPLELFKSNGPLTPAIDWGT